MRPRKAVIIVILLAVTVLSSCYPNPKKALEANPQQSPVAESPKGESIGENINPNGIDALLSKPNEQVVFSFRTDNLDKVLSICISQRPNYIVYRFGTSEKLELEYPTEDLENSWGKFMYSYYLRGGGKSNLGLDLDYLTFENGGYVYQVYQEYSAEDNLTRVGVRVSEKGSKNIIEISGNASTRVGSLGSLRTNNNIRKSPSSAYPVQSGTDVVLHNETNRLNDFLSTIVPKGSEVTQMLQADLDGDGSTEIVVSFGNSANKFSSTCIIRKTQNGYEHIGELKNSSIGSVSNVKLVKLDSSSWTYVFMSVTNGGPSNGFVLAGLKGNEIRTIDSQFSDNANMAYMLVENDGVYRRVDYLTYDDVQRHKLKVTYHWNGERFVENGRQISYSQGQFIYPQVPMDVVKCYLDATSLGLQDERKLMVTSDKVLGFSTADRLDLNNGSGVLPSLGFEMIIQDGNYALIQMTNPSSEYNRTLYFELALVEGMWKIGDVSGIPSGLPGQKEQTIVYRAQSIVHNFVRRPNGVAVYYRPKLDIEVDGIRYFYFFISYNYWSISKPEPGENVISSIFVNSVDMSLYEAIDSRSQSTLGKRLSK